MDASPDTRATGAAVDPRDLRKPLTYVIACFAVWGFAYGLLDVLNKHVQETLHVGKAQSAWLQAAYFGAYVVMALPAGQVLRTFGYKVGIVLGLAVTAAGALLFVPSSQLASFDCLVGSTFVLASGLCVLETASNTYVSVLGPARYAPRRLNFAQSFTAVGIFFGPLVGGLLLFQSGDAAVARSSLQAIYLGTAIAVLVFAAFVARARLPEPSAGPQRTCEPDGVARANAPLARPRFVFGVLTQTLYVGAQVGCAAFFLNLVTETWPGLTSQQGAFLLTLAAGGSIIGRFVTTAVLLRLRPRTVLALYGAADVVLCLLVSAGLAKISAMALMATFFFMAPMFATLFVLSTAGLGAATKRGGSVMMMAAGGGVLLPYPMGRIAETCGTPASFLLPAVGFAAVALYGLFGTRADGGAAGTATGAPADAGIAGRPAA